MSAFVADILQGVLPTCVQHEDTLGVTFVMPLTFGFFDFHPLDVLSEGIPTRVDSFSLVPGLELDYLMENDWHLIPYARAGASVASSSIDGWLYGVGVRIERERSWRGWDPFNSSGPCDDLLGPLPVKTRHTRHCPDAPSGRVGQQTIRSSSSGHR